MARQALQILLRGLVDLWDQFLVLAVANLIWAISLVPGLGINYLLPGVPGVAVGLVLIILITGPVTLGLYVLCADVSRRERLELNQFFGGVKQYYRRGWLLALLNVAFVVLGFFNVVFYTSSQFNNTPLSYAVVIWVYLAFLWFSLQIYLWPIAARMEKFSLVGLLRNSFLAAFKYPLISLLLGLVLAVFFFLSSLIGFLPVILFGMVYHALVSNKALSAVLVREREREEALKAKGESAPANKLEVPPLPERKPEEPGVFSTRNAPPGVVRRGPDRK